MLQKIFSQRTDKGKTLDWLLDHTKLLQQVFKKADPKALTEVLRTAFSGPVGPDAKERLAYFLAANEANLNRGLVTLPGYSPPKDRQQWCHWQLLDLSFPDDKGKIRAVLRCLSGYPALETLEEVWTEGRCRVLGRIAGFTAPWGSFPYRRREEMLGFLFVADTNREHKFGRSTFKMEGIKCNSASLNYNRQLLRVRRRDKLDCLRGFDFDCQSCTLGLGDCPAAVRPRTLEPRTCDVCGFEFWVDPKTGFRCGERCSCSNSGESQ